MKKLSAFLFLLTGLNHFVWSQNGEFKVHNNGLVYSPETMQKLHHIVDSLNLKFRRCELNKVYLSTQQTIGHYISADDRFEEMQQDLEKNISFETFEKKYPSAIKRKNVLIVKYLYNYDEKDIVELNEMRLDDGYGFEISREDKSFYHKKLKGAWIFNYHNKSEYSSESLAGFYFIDEFVSQAIQENYARMIQYADCMVDTTARVFLEDSQRTSIRDSYEENKNISKFMDLVAKYESQNPPPSYPKYPESDEIALPEEPKEEPKTDENILIKDVVEKTNRKERKREEKREKIMKKYQEDYEKYQKARSNWEKNKQTYIENTLSKTPEFQQLLKSATEDAIKNGGYYDEFEYYVEKYLSPEKALLLKRKRRVIGGCSQDDSPRLHALDIARLSAETINWEVFLRSHLDIMNDRFERVSDGSYAWGQRATYIGELENLEIDVLDLLLGISLRIENPAQNHYFGSIGRVGRALAESKDLTAVENKILSMIEDNQLDNYNRVLMYYLFLNYNYHLTDKTHKKANLDKLKLAMKKLSENLTQNIDWEEIEKNQLRDK
jgi:hypothetical protein